MVLRSSYNHIRRLPRYREVANILVRNGFGFIIEQLDWHWWKKEEKDVEKSLRGHSMAIRLRQALEELGPTYVKLGQLMSTRPDLLPSVYITELEKLQDDVAPIPYGIVTDVLEREGLDPELSFTWINPEPIAAASIAQVHEALLPGGQRVVIKVQRPGVDKMIEHDLAILMELARVFEKRSSWAKLYRVSEVVAELGESLKN
ncbi:MAG: ABC1 kinase family protein, partial [Deltaproteobacteria bacterium]